MKKRLVVLLVFVQLFSLFSSCTINVNKAEKKETGSGVITGKALYSNLNQTDNAGIIVTLEKTDGIRASAVAGTSTTAADGSYIFENLTEGTYTIYAASNYSKEKAVCTNIQVRSTETTVAQTLNLTATGAIKGRITKNGSETGNLGFLVFIAGTSYMAMTNNAGNFTISDVPAAEGYELVVTDYKENKFMKIIDILPDQTATTDTYNFSKGKFIISSPDDYNITLIPNKTVRTNQDILITINATNSNIATAGYIYNDTLTIYNSINDIINNQKFNNISANSNGVYSFKADRNGYYTAVTKDIYGNYASSYINITNIDKTPPTGSLNEPIYNKESKTITFTWTNPTDEDYAYREFICYECDNELFQVYGLELNDCCYEIEARDNFLYIFEIRFYDDLGNVTYLETSILAREKFSAGDVVLDDGSVVHHNGDITNEENFITQEQIGHAVGILIPYEDNDYWNPSFFILGLNQTNGTFEEAQSFAYNYDTNNLGSWTLPTISEYKIIHNSFVLYYIMEVLGCEDFHADDVDDFYWSSETSGDKIKIFDFYAPDYEWTFPPDDIGWALCVKEFNPN